MRSVGLADIDAVFLTHLHVDHWLGLPGMLKSFDLRDRDAPLDGLRPARHGRAACARCASSRAARLPARRRRARGAATASSSTATRSRVHRPPPRPRVRLRARRGPAPGPLRRRARRRALGVPFGPDFGRLQRGETVNGVRARAGHRARPRPGRRIVLSGDTAPCDDGPRRRRTSADLLVHEATFTEEERERARARPATRTARQAAELAARGRACGCSRSRTSRRATAAREIRDEARAVFAEHGRPARLRRDRDPVPREGRARARALGRAPGAPARVDRATRRLRAGRRCYGCAAHVLL